MSKSFILLDKNNNLEKTANMIVKFNYEEKDYIVYSVEENEQNSQIFVSKLILNSEGKYFVDNILPEEKNKLSNIVYNIVILLPSDYEKGNDFQSLINNLFNKFSVKLLNGLPDMENQEYYSNCSIAITNKVLVDNAVKLYDEKLNVVVNDEPSFDVPMWTSPASVTAPTPVDVNINDVQEEPIINQNVPVKESVSNIDLSLQPNSGIELDVPNLEKSVVVPDVVDSVSKPVDVIVPELSTDVDTDTVLPNPQAEKLAIVSDPSLGIGVQQPNIMQNKKAGFANSKYVVIGSICLVLAIAVIVTAYILIKNMG